MTFPELLKMVEELNRDLLRPFSSDGSNGPANDKASVEVGWPTLEKCAGESGFCGILRESPVAAADYADRITLVSGQRTGAVAVGFVIDDATKGTHDDRDVVLAVGINYGQGDAYLVGGVDLIDATAMRPKLEAAFRAVASCGKCDADWRLPSGDEPPYHLVVVNIFPWITRRSWSAYGFNAIEEALFIKCLNPVDVGQYVATFIERTTRRGFRALIFHGANNAVPYFGAEFVTARSRGFRSEHEVVFCDNLAPSYRAAVSNSVHLCKRHMSKGDMADACIDE
jgi:hypothetical protein